MPYPYEVLPGSFQYYFPLTGVSNCFKDKCVRVLRILHRCTSEDKVNQKSVAFIHDILKAFTKNVSQATLLIDQIRRGHEKG